MFQITFKQHSITGGKTRKPHGFISKEGSVCRPHGFISKEGSVCKAHGFSSKECVVCVLYRLSHLWFWITGIFSTFVASQRSTKSLFTSDREAWHVSPHQDTTGEKFNLLLTAVPTQRWLSIILIPLSSIAWLMHTHTHTHTLLTCPMLLSRWSLHWPPHRRRRTLLTRSHGNRSRSWGPACTAHMTYGEEGGEEHTPELQITNKYGYTCSAWLRDGITLSIICEVIWQRHPVSLYIQCYTGLHLSKSISHVYGTDTCLWHRQTSMVQAHVYGADTRL